MQVRRGCIRKDAPAGAGGTGKYPLPLFLLYATQKPTRAIALWGDGALKTNTQFPLFFCIPPRGQRRARGGDSRRDLRVKRKAQRADVRKDEARGRAKGVGGRGRPEGAQKNHPYLKARVILFLLKDYGMCAA